MIPATIIREAQANGVTLLLSATETVKVTGGEDEVSRWVPAIREHKAGIVTLLQEAAILAWLAQIGETDETTVDEVLTKCRHDSDARAYYLGRARHAATDDLDDRRSCRQCSNLRSGVCIVAKPGGIVSATRGYRPATPELLRRCDGYAP